MEEDELLKPNSLEQSPEISTHALRKNETHWRVG